jgi:hypothetical protein
VQACAAFVRINYAINGAYVETFHAGPSEWLGAAASPITPACYNSAPRGEPMPNVSSIVRQLKKKRDRVEKQLSGLNAALTAFAGVYRGGKPVRRRRMSAKSRAKIAAVQRRRWAKFRAKRKS